MSGKLKGKSKKLLEDVILSLSKDGAEANPPWFDRLTMTPRSFWISCNDNLL
jgi:hypothetical protein